MTDGVWVGCGGVVRDRTLHMIGNAHVAPVWLWQWQEGYQEAKATFRSALDRLREYPEWVFTSSSAAMYEHSRCSLLRAVVIGDPAEW